MTIGLKIYKENSDIVTLDVTDRITRLIGSITGNGSITVPDDGSTIFTTPVITTSTTFDAFDAAKATVKIEGRTVTVSGAQSYLLTYVGVY